MKLRLDGHLSSGMFIYVDESRIISHSELVCWQAENRFFSICNSLGIQDAPRKRTGPSLNPVPWTGTVAHMSNKEVVIKTTQIKWENKEYCPRTGDIDEGVQGTPQKIGVHKRFPNICGQEFQVDDAIPQGTASDY